MSALLLAVLIAFAALLTASALFHWLFAESTEKTGSPTARPVRVNFYDAVIWNAFRRWGQNKPLQLSYRRDRRGRFRKLR